MNDSVEELLEVDALRQAVRGNENTLASSFFVRGHVGNPVASLVRRENARDGLDVQFGECLSQAGRASAEKQWGRGLSPYFDCITLA